MSDFSNTKILTFDCYGTLIDWERGIVNALSSILKSHDATIDSQRLLELYAGFEADEEKKSYKPYKDILASVLKSFGHEFNFIPTNDELNSFSHSVADWPPFGDTVASLVRLKEKYKLAIISNIDADLFAQSNERLEVEFDYIITAESVGAYKPSLSVFNAALERIDFNKAEIIHCAQSLYHDIAPARSLGLQTVWVNRRHGQTGSGATPECDTAPDHYVKSLKELADLLCD